MSHMRRHQDEETMGALQGPQESRSENQEQKKEAQHTRSWHWRHLGDTGNNQQRKMESLGKRRTIRNFFCMNQAQSNSNAH